LVGRIAGGVVAVACVSGLVAAGAIGRPTNGGTGAALGDRAAFLDLVATRAAGSDLPGAPVAAPPISARAVGPPIRFSYPLLREPAPPLEPLRLNAGRPPARRAIADQLSGILADRRLGSRVGLAVADAATGRLIYGYNPAGGFIPASTTKILTAAASLTSLGPAARLRTSVARVGSDEIVLVGGGDPMLVSGTAPVDPVGYPVPARLSTLADRTARALTEAGVRTVDLRYDAGLFAGPGRAASWRAAYIAAGSAVVAPVSALTVDHGYVGDPRRETRSADPARQAAELFARQLRSAGIEVSGPILPGSAGGAPELAAVQSPPISTVVEVMLAASDNDIAEALARHVALASKRPATFDGAAQAIRAVVARLGVDVAGVHLLDGSGLSRANVISPQALADLLTVTAQPAYPKLRTVLVGLPVAGFSGTLSERSATVSLRGSPGPGTVTSAGLVRAKTGTLRGVRSLAGYVRSAGGRLLTFAVIADRLPRRDGDAAEPVLDALAAALTAR
jgi:D-alanyl-D-alanine carboxypeptidase/D-alanyl-D-alanine-endopeptidase (penicillin-binding protein 4)